MKNIRKHKYNKDPMGEAMGHKLFSRYLEDAKVKTNLGTEIYNARIAMGISQQELAKKISSTQKDISKIENGDVDVGTVRLNRLFKELNFTSINLAVIFNRSSLAYILSPDKGATYNSPSTLVINEQKSNEINMTILSLSQTI